MCSGRQESGQGQLREKVVAFSALRLVGQGRVGKIDFLIAFDLSTMPLYL
jgi:hypothetical protein